MSDKKTGILLLSHGSRLDDGEEVIKAYKEMYAEEFPDIPVEYGFMEIRKPGIPETIKKLTEENDAGLCSTRSSHKKGHSGIVRN